MEEWFPSAVYLLCFAASSTCAFLLIRGYRQSGARLLFWSGICFLFLAANNFVVIVDMVIVQQQDFRLVRILLSLVAVSVLLFGLIWHREGRQ
jgi:ABC-type transport system involved in cytochrome c biogenesis permease subunit